VWSASAPMVDVPGGGHILHERSVLGPVTGIPALDEFLWRSAMLSNFIALGSALGAASQPLQARGAGDGPTCKRSYGQRLAQGVSARPQR